MGGLTFADPVSGAPSFTGKIFRALVSTMKGGGPTTRVFGAASGVRPNTPASVVSASSTTWSVGPHAGVLDTSASGTDGATDYTFQTAQTGSVDPADSTNDRVDLLAVQLSDPSEGDGTSVPGVAVIYQAGTPGAGIPANATARSFVLAQINVPRATHGSPTVTWVAPNCVGAGGIQPVAGSAVYPASPYEGQPIYDKSTDTLYVSDGTNWRPFVAASIYRAVRNTTISLVAGTPTPVVAYPGTAVVVGSDITFSGGVLTAVRAGLYRWDESTTMPAGTGIVEAFVELNGAGINDGQQHMALASGHAQVLSTGGLIPMNAGDTLQLVVESLDTNITATPKYFSLERRG